MERLTERYGDNGVELVDDTIEAPGVAETVALHRLADYEDTGLTPSQVAELQERQRWVPVLERTPRPFVSVLVHVPDEAPLPTVHEGYISDTGVWMVHAIGRAEVTDWAEMPEPPEEAHDENRRGNRRD